jgi:hypothetical protein
LDVFSALSYEGSPSNIRGVRYGKPQL